MAPSMCNPHDYLTLNINPLRGNCAIHPLTPRIQVYCLYTNLAMVQFEFTQNADWSACVPKQSSKCICGWVTSSAGGKLLAYCSLTVCLCDDAQGPRIAPLSPWAPPSRPCKTLPHCNPPCAAHLQPVLASSNVHAAATGRSLQV